MLCRNSLDYQSQFMVEGLLGITLDEKEVFLVNIKECIKSDKVQGAQCSLASQQQEHEAMEAQQRINPYMIPTPFWKDRQSDGWTTEEATGQEQGIISRAVTPMMPGFKGPFRGRGRRGRRRMFACMSALRRKFADPSDFVSCMMGEVSGLENPENGPKVKRRHFMPMSAVRNISEQDETSSVESMPLSEASVTAAKDNKHDKGLEVMQNVSEMPDCKMQTSKSTVEPREHLDEQDMCEDSLTVDESCADAALQSDSDLPDDQHNQVVTDPSSAADGVGPWPAVNPLAPGDELATVSQNVKCVLPTEHCTCNFKLYSRYKVSYSVMIPVCWFSKSFVYR